MKDRNCNGEISGFFSSAIPSLLFTPSLVAHQDVDLSPSHLSSFLVSILARAPSRSLSWLTHIFTFFVLIIG